MAKEDKLYDNPLKQLGFEDNNIIPAGGFGAVLARAGIGKTSVIVQVALSSMLRGKSVLHISLDDPVKKINLWYKEIFQLLVSQEQISPQKGLWESILPKRFIMALKSDEFSAPKLEKRLMDLADQDIFSPDVIIIDDLLFDESVRSTMLDLKSLADQTTSCIWFTVHIHRHEKTDPDGLPVQLSGVYDLIDAAILIQAEEQGILVKKLKGGTTSNEQEVLTVDPSTMLVKG